LEPFALL
jgi:acetyl esterase/lipase